MIKGQTLPVVDQLRTGRTARVMTDQVLALVWLYMGRVRGDERRVYFLLERDPFYSGAPHYAWQQAGGSVFLIADAQYGLCSELFFPFPLFWMVRAPCCRMGGVGALNLNRICTDTELALTDDLRGETAR